MRIARVLTRLNLGGPARQVLASDPLLVENGHQVRILAGTPEPGEGDLLTALVERGLDVVRIPRLRRGITPARDLVARRRIRRELAAFRPDVVHTHASKAGYLGRKASRGMRVGRVHTFHGHVLEGYFPAPFSKRLVATERRLARETDRVVAVSRATAQDLLRLRVVPQERLVVVEPGVDLERFLAIERVAERRRGPLRESLGLGTDAFLVGVIGRLAEVKQPQRAVRVLERLTERFPQLRLVFVGDGSERGRLLQAIAGAGCTGRAFLAGSRTDMPAVLEELDAVLLTSRTEGMPVALIEAGAAALPVVARDVGGVGELVEHERTGFLAETDEELSHGLGRLLEDEQRGRVQGERARERVCTRFGAVRLAERLQELYEEVLQARRGES